MKFDREADVLVVGSGAAGLSAAITASNEGADVILLEKGEIVGGTTLRSGGGFWTPNNRFQRENDIEDAKEDAIRYMARYSYPQLYNPEDARLGLPDNEFNLIDTYYDNAHKTIEYLEDCGALETIMEINWTGKPQVDYMDHLPQNKGIRGRVLYSKNKKGKMAYGGELVRQLRTWLREKDIPILTSHRVVRILQDAKDQVVGLEVEVNGEKRLRFGAKKAVIFGSGGYTHSADKMLRFQRGPHFGGCSAPTNEGDFIDLAGAIGAKLGNTAGAFRAEIILEDALSDPNGVHNVFYVLGDSVIEVNRYGLRVMDEKRNYNDRAMVHIVWDPQRAEWTNMLVFMIYDARTAKLWQGFPPLPVGDNKPDSIIEAQTWEELADAIGKRLEALKTHTGGFSLAPGFLENLKYTVKRFNGFAKSGHDEDFNRGKYNYDREWTTFPPTVPDVKWPPEDTPNLTMYPLSDEGPYYAIILGAGTLDTNGGPIINHEAQVLHVNGEPIKGLYGAGNCIASPTANAYWGAGSTLGPAMTYGHIAAMHAVKEPDKQ